MLAWVVGSGGMLGSALVRRVDAEGTALRSDPIPWHDGTAAAAALAAGVERLAREAGDGPWAVLWAAGSSIVASSNEDTDAERLAFTALIDALAERRPEGPGALFVTSSAGGVYAGSADPPFDLSTAPVPISPYGSLKLAQEQIATDRLAGRLPVVIGRFSNLYGTGHDTTKGQGLIPQLCLAAVRRRPINLYVSMDTVRDYLYVDDAAAMAWRLTARAVAEQPASPVVAIIASGQPTTVASVIAMVQTVTHRRVPVALGTHPSAARQAVDLRLVPTVDTDDLAVPLPNGIARVFDALVGRVA